MSGGGPRTAVVLMLAAALLRPPSVPDTVWEGGSVRGALATLAEAGEELEDTSGARSFGEHYDHWSEGATEVVVPEGGPNEDEVRRRATAVGDFGAHTCPHHGHDHDAAGGDHAHAHAHGVDEDAPSPVMAGFVALAAATGLRDLAALVLYLKADIANHAGDWQMFHLSLRAVTLVDPHFVDAYVMRAYSYRHSDPARARRILARGVRWNPEDWELWHDLAWADLRVRPGKEPDLEAAEESLRRATSCKHPYFVRRLHARVLASLGREDEARDVLEGLLATPGVPEADRELAEQGLVDLEAGVDKLALLLERNRQKLEARLAAEHEHDEHDEHEHP